MLVQPSGCSSQYSGILPSVDLWDTVEGSQQGAGAHAFFTRIPESCRFDPPGSDSQKLEDKLIAVPRTFILLIGKQTSINCLGFLSKQGEKDRSVELKSLQSEFCISSRLTSEQSHRGKVQPVEPGLCDTGRFFLLERLKLLQLHFLQDFKLHLIHSFCQH